MRTTLDIDADVLEAAKAIARQEHSTAGRVLSALARRSLVGDPACRRIGESGERYGIEVIPAGERPMTTDRVNELMDEEGA